MTRACLKIGLPNSHGSWSMAISGRYLPYIRPIYWRIYDHVHNEIATFRIHPSFRQPTPIWLCFQSISILCSSMVNARKWHRNPNHSLFQKSDFSIAMNCHELPWIAMNCHVCWRLGTENLLRKTGWNQHHQLCTVNIAWVQLY
jgi:hypothetical protein